MRVFLFVLSTNRWHNKSRIHNLHKDEQREQHTQAQGNDPVTQLKNNTEREAPTRAPSLNRDKKIKKGAEMHV